MRPDPSTLSPETLAYIETLESNLQTVQEVLDHLPRCSGWSKDQICPNYGTIRDGGGRWVCDSCSSKCVGLCGELGAHTTTARVWNELRKDARMWIPPDPITSQGLVIKLRSASLHAASLLLLSSSGIAAKARILLSKAYKDWEDPISEELVKVREENNLLWGLVHQLPRCFCGKPATHVKVSRMEPFADVFLCGEHHSLIPESSLLSYSPALEAIMQILEVGKEHGKSENKSAETP